MKILVSVTILLLGLMLLPIAAFGSCISDVMDVSDAGWRDASTKPIEDRLLKHSQPPNKITIHYTGVKKNEKLSLQKKLKGLYRFSTTEKTPFKKHLWGDVPYNFYIDALGKMALGTTCLPSKNQNCFQQSRPFKISSISRPKKSEHTSITPAPLALVKPSGPRWKSTNRSRKILSPKNAPQAQKEALGRHQKDPGPASKSLPAISHRHQTQHLKDHVHTDQPG